MASPKRTIVDMKVACTDMCTTITTLDQMIQQERSKLANDARQHGNLSLEVMEARKKRIKLLEDMCDIILQTTLNTLKSIGMDNEEEGHVGNSNNPYP